MSEMNAQDGDSIYLIASYNSWVVVNLHTDDMLLPVLNTENTSMAQLGKICGNSFGKVYAVNRHKRSNTDESPFTCSICNETFQQEKHLKNHVKTHSGDKPFI